MSWLANKLMPFPTERPQTKLFNDYRAKMSRMDGKVVCITGTTSGTGQVLATVCGELGAKVITLNRPSERADKALAALKAKNIDAVQVGCDLQRYESVREAAQKVRELCPDGIDVLCNNAGVMGLPDQATPDGFDVQMQSNHLSHFLLTSELFPLLEKGAEKRGEARVVNHSSGARNAPAGPISAQYLGKNGGNLGGDGFPGMGKWRRYQQSKLANLLFTYALHDRIAAERPSAAGKVKSLCAHPGPTDSGLQGKTSAAGGTGMLDHFILCKTMRNAQSVEDGTLGILRACCEAGVNSLDFYGPSAAGMPGPADLLPAERNAEGEKLLWEVSLLSTGLSKFFA